MKKTILILALATVAISCKKVAAGGAHGVIKMAEGATRYSDDPQGETDPATVAHGAKAAGTVFKRDTTAKAAHASAVKDSAAVKTEVPATQAHESTVNSMSAPVNHGAAQTK